MTTATPVRSTAAHAPVAGLATIRATDPAIADLIQHEADRQESTLELIASENHTSPAVMATMGTCLTNKYAEGYPGARYYHGCEFHDQIESIAIDRAKQMFGCKFANVQPHSGAQANAAVFMAWERWPPSLRTRLAKVGGHLSHGMKINFSGRYYNPVHYPLHYGLDHPESERIDYDAVEKTVLEHKPKMLLCGYSAYPRVIDFARLRTIADKAGALLMADVAHIAGLIVGGAHPNPFPHAHVVTTTTHKTLRGPRGGLIMTNDDEIAKKIDKAVFPGMQGGPLMHVIAAKAVAFGECLKPDFKTYSVQVVKNAKALAAALVSHGYRITTGGTDNHLMLVDLRKKSEALTGYDASKWLETAGIITNMNGVPNDSRPPKVTSGIRLGTPATTTRGLKEADMATIASFIDRVLSAGVQGPAELEAATKAVRADVRALCAKFPLPH